MKANNLRIFQFDLDTMRLEMIREMFQDMRCNLGIAV